MLKDETESEVIVFQAMMISGSAERLKGPGDRLKVHVSYGLSGSISTATRATRY